MYDMVIVSNDWRDFMHAGVKEYLEKQWAVEAAAKKKERDEFLIELGLFEKVFSDNDQYSDEYPNYEWDAEKQITRYYKKVPYEATDEEYEAIKKASMIKASKNNATTSDNVVGYALSVIAWVIYIGGIIAGFYFGASVSEYSNEFSLEIAIVYWCIAFVSGTMFLGFAEISRLLNDIKNK